MTIIKKFARFLPASVRKPLGVLWEKLRYFTSPPLESLPDSPDLFCVYRYLNLHPDLERRPGGWLYQGKIYPDYLTVGGASCAIFGKALKFCHGKGVDVGAGFWPLPGSIPVDVGRGEGLGRLASDYDEVSLDYVFSSHCLEHIDNWQDALAEWVRKIRPGGILFLYLPHPECAIWHPGSPFVGDGHRWIPTPEIVGDVVERLGCEIVSVNKGPDAMQSFYVCARKEAGVTL